MGLFSLTMNTLVITPASYLFSPFVPHGNLYSLIIAIVPRILIGVTPYFVYRWIRNRTGLMIAGIDRLYDQYCFRSKRDLLLLWEQLWRGNSTFPWLDCVY